MVPFDTVYRLILWFHPVSLSLSQTFQNVEEREEGEEGEEGEEAEWEHSADKKGPLARTLSQSSLHRRKSTRGTSFTASEGEKEGKEKLKDCVTEEVSCAETSLNVVYAGQTISYTLILKHYCHM